MKQRYSIRLWQTAETISMQLLYYAQYLAAKATSNELINILIEVTATIIQTQ